MDRALAVMNELMVDIFNDILTIEQSALRAGSFNDLSVTEIHTIEAIGMYVPRNMSEVAGDLNITVGTLTIAIGNLVKKGYVERKRSDEDRRVVKIALTKRGKLAYRIHAKFHRDMIKETTNGLNEEEKNILVNSLEKLNIFLKEKYKLKTRANRE
ncbi:transcriptional regulator, MarR family [Clostridium acidisoli DSM 12555]|uniref:Transcriptional regulator, MarR family n=1 Tax=Clostridium acidisoli DSM 12555 TaxID=1121291 RepID=A0A1W1XRQ7_9CLOT|nr:MarR family transcriptional regulator [Clostridium acidisoli]SMC26221.1 transcriptional regulator, MarR family [Clostridium acidisoli DSM 12555]